MPIAFKSDTRSDLTVFRLTGEVRLKDLLRTISAYVKAGFTRFELYDLTTHDGTPFSVEDINRIADFISSRAGKLPDRGKNRRRGPAGYRFRQFSHARRPDRYRNPLRFRSVPHPGKGHRLARGIALSRLFPLTGSPACRFSGPISPPRSPLTDNRCRYTPSLRRNPCASHPAPSPWRRGGGHGARGVRTKPTAAFGRKGWIRGTRIPTTVRWKSCPAMPRGAHLDRSGGGPGRGADRTQTAFSRTGGPSGAAGRGRL